ncbi:putative Dilute domain-containing protein [Helianthus debilis subsp. tardiflorus]
MADNMRIEETLMVHGTMLIRLEAAAIRNERSFAEIRETLDGLVERLDVLNTNLANQSNLQITTDRSNNDLNTSGETEISRFNVKDVTVDEIAQVKNQQGVNNQNDQDLLIECIAQPLGFSKGIPTAACIIYKCLSHWRSFKAEKTSIFDRIIQTIDHKTEKQDDNNVLAYWLSTASTLLVLTQRQLEAKSPASLFKMQLSASVEKIYGMIRDDLKEQISPLLGLCIQAPRKSRENLLKGPTFALASAAAQDNLIAHWQEIVNKIECFLNMLKSNNLPPFLVRKLFTQIFFFINVELFKSILLRRECCSLSNGEYVKAGLSELEQWCYKATEETKYRHKCTNTRLRHFIPVDSSWHRLFELAHMPSYRELLVEFLSTFTFHPPQADQPPGQPHAPPPLPEVSFRLAGVWRSMTLA